MKYLRSYAGADGESHFEDVEVALTPTVVYPGIPPLGLSASHGAAQVIFGRIPAALRDAGWHTARQRQFVVYLAGETEQEASDGEIRRVGPGDVILAEDTTGKGHRSRNLGGEQLVVFIGLGD